SDAVSLTPSHGVKLFNALMFALIGAVLAPRLAEITWPRFQWGIGRRLSLTALLLLFWNGYLDFPLSDFPALAMALLALIAVDRSSTYLAPPVAIRAPTFSDMELRAWCGRASLEPAADRRIAPAAL